MLCQSSLRAKFYNLLLSGCSKNLVLTSIGDSNKHLEKYIGDYVQSIDKYNGYHIYKKEGNNSIISYLFFRPEYGWRVKLLIILNELRVQYQYLIPID